MLGWSLACSLEFSLSPFNLHSVLSCDQKAGQEQRPPKGTLSTLPTGVWPSLDSRRVSFLSCVLCGYGPEKWIVPSSSHYCR